mgnify:CR=1 FL=1
MNLEIIGIVYEYLDGVLHVFGHDDHLYRFNLAQHHLTFEPAGELIRYTLEGNKQFIEFTDRGVRYIYELPGN